MRVDLFWFGNYIFFGFLGKINLGWCEWVFIWKVRIVLWSEKRGFCSFDVN